MSASTPVRRAPLDAIVAAHGEAQVMPTSSAQRRFWILDQLDPSGGAYTISLALRLGGQLDTAALQASLNTIIARHESLRTIFALEGEEPVQVVLPELALVVEAHDLSVFPPSELEAHVRSAAVTNANRPFDLARGPLVRASLLRLADSEHVLLLALHHIIADGWSVGVLYRELDACYAAFAGGRVPALRTLPLQYPDYAVWQRRMLETPGAAKQLAFWKEKLAGPLPTLALPTDRPWPAVQTRNGAKRVTLLPTAVVDAMRALAKRKSVTPYMAFLTAFVIMLRRYTGQDDLIVGSIIAGRPRPELESLIGLFVNTLALRVDASGDPTFRKLLGRVRETTVSALANQAVPFEEVAESLGAGRDRSRSPVFQAAFQLLEGVANELHLAGLSVERLPAAKDTAKFELTLMLHTAPNGGIRAVMEYNTDLYDAATVDRMLAQYATLLRSIVLDPATPISRLRLMPPREYATVIDEWNRTAAEFPADRFVHELVDAQARRTPDAAAVAMDGRTLTYTDLTRCSSDVARQLRARGVGPEVGVGVCIERSPELVIVVLGILKAGGYYLPLDPDYPAERLGFIVTDSGVSLVVTQPHLQGVLPADVPRVLLLDQSEAGIELRSSGEEVPVSSSDPFAGASRREASADNLAYMIYTSGSTGRPKGVEIEHRSVVNFLAGLATTVAMEPHHSLVAVTPLSFDISVLELFAPLVSGARVIIASRDVALDPHALAELLERTGATHLQATPSTWRLLVEAGWPGRPGMVALCGGEAMSQALSDALLARGLQLWNLYGPTEATIWATTHHPTTVGESVRIGRPMPNVRAYVLDASIQPMPIGVPGELYLAGQGLARGYHGRPELTAQQFVADPFAVDQGARMYRTGDRVRWHADGNLEYLGRTDYQIKLRGHRIELGEIEAVLGQHPGVTAAVVMVREEVPAEPRLVAYVVPTGSILPSPAELRTRVRQALPEVMVPAAIVFLDRFPMTQNGKVDRNALTTPTDEHALGAEYVAPRTPLEADIASAWRAVLKLERVGVHDDFFDLGGHSLSAMRVLARLAPVLPVTLTIRAILEARTVATLATRVVESLGGSDVVSDEEMKLLMAELEGMSDDDAERLAGGGRGVEHAS